MMGAVDNAYLFVNQNSSCATLRTRENTEVEKTRSNKQEKRHNMGRPSSAVPFSNWHLWKELLTLHYFRSIFGVSMIDNGNLLTL